MDGEEVKEMLIKKQLAGWRQIGFDGELNSGVGEKSLKKCRYS